MNLTLALLSGFLLDLIFGDKPIANLPHPVVFMGRAIERLEPWLRRRFPETPQGELSAGCVLAAIVPTATLGITAFAYKTAKAISPFAGFLFQTLGCWQALALKGLADESRAVYARLSAEDLAGARTAVGRIVGRDTAALDEAAITRATVETVAENFSDGVMAPLTAMAVGGAPAALTYKAINTLDSMVGYRNQRYEYFGRASAKLDDVANFLPARMAALCWITGASLDGQDGVRAWETWHRDRLKHPSPNSAQCEAACAGALGIQLGGPSTYGGVVHDKPFLGDPVNPVTPAAIQGARRTLYAAGIIACAGVMALRLVIGGLFHAFRRRGRHG